MLSYIPRGQYDFCIETLQFRLPLYDAIPNPWTTYLGVKEREALVDVLNLVHSHFAGVWFAQFLAGNDLQKSHQVLSVGQVHEEIVFLERNLI